MILIYAAIVFHRNQQIQVYAICGVVIVIIDVTHSDIRYYFNNIFQLSNAKRYSFSNCHFCNRHKFIESDFDRISSYRLSFRFSLVSYSLGELNAVFGIPFTVSLPNSFSSLIDVWKFQNKMHVCVCACVCVYYMYYTFVLFA